MIELLESERDNIEVDLIDCIGPAYYEMFWDIEEHNNLIYWLEGGRGSLKSSFAFIYTIYSMTRDIMNGEIVHSVALRKVKDTLRDSVFNNFLWAIDLLKLNWFWNATISPLKITHEDSTILFRGCNNQRDYEKIKSIKFKKGKLKNVIYEELTEFAGMDEILSINQSLLRNTDEAIVFTMYNPPPNKSNWVNEEARKKDDDIYVHHSTYLDAPKEWLGNIFIKEAEKLKRINPRKYAHMYMGKQIGEGLEIYPNVEIREITNEEMKKFTQIKRGLDFGHVHCTCYSESFYDKELDIIYIFGEIYSPGLTNKTLIRLLKEKAISFPIRADNENPNLINELRIGGLNIIKTIKGQGSKEHGIKWLADRAKIVIDKKRCPNIASDFQLYEFKKDKNGKKILEYPEEPDGSASVRYGLEDIIRQSKIIFPKRPLRR